MSTLKEKLQKLVPMSMEALHRIADSEQLILYKELRAILEEGEDEEKSEWPKWIKVCEGGPRDPEFLTWHHGLEAQVRVENAEEWELLKETADKMGSHLLDTKGETITVAEFIETFKD